MLLIASSCSPSLLNFQLHLISQQWQRHNEGLYLNRGAFGISLMCTTFWQCTDFPMRYTELPKLLGIAAINIFCHLLTINLTSFLALIFSWNSLKMAIRLCNFLRIGQPVMLSVFQVDSLACWQQKSLLASADTFTTVALFSVSFFM